MTYFEEMKRTMDWLAQQPDTLFIGQAVACEGTAMTNTIRDVPRNKKIEFPVAEEMQLSASLGLSLQGGCVPISIFPRWNFLLLAANSLVNHIDKLPLMSEYKNKVIIRTSVGSCRPLHPQHQHVGDFTDAFRLLLKTIEVIRLDEPEDIFPAYVKAYNNETSTIVVEWGDYYSEK